MKNMCKTLLPAVIFLLAIMQAEAQSTKGNILSNGEFEQWDRPGKPTGWRIEESLFPEKVEDSRPGGSGTYALKVYLNDFSIFLDPDVSVQPEKKYTISFWYKGNINYNDIKLSVLWKKGWQIKKRDYDFIVATTDKDEWLEAKGVITSPADIDAMSIKVRMQAESRGHVIFDDFTVVPEGGDEPSEPALEAPQNLKIAAHQGEMEISWDKVDDAEVTWEVTFDDEVVATTPENSFVKTNLAPARNHTVKVRAIKGTTQSNYSELSETTQGMEKGIADTARVPYLRTITPDGNCEGLFLKLYYNELANPAATITYKLDGNTITPQNNTLEFPTFSGDYKQFNLEVAIDEGEGRTWNISYPQLVVKKL